MSDTTATPSTAGQSPTGDQIKDLLDKVKKEITQFESKQLAQLKVELEAFHKKKSAVVDEYKAKLPALTEKWILHNAEVERLHRCLVCLYKDTWRGHFTKCICEKQAAVSVMEKALERRLANFKGERERARDEAKATSDKAKARLDTLIANTARIEASLKENDKWLAEIKKLLETGSAVAIHVFWNRLLPKHRQLMPDALAGSLKFADGETPEQLCQIAGTGSGGSAKAVPSLIDPSMFENEIVEAWTAYRTSKEAHGSAEASYNANPDDLASTTKQLEEAQKALDGQIRDCLVSATATMKPCCDGTDGSQTTLNDAGKGSAAPLATDQED